MPKIAKELSALEIGRLREPGFHSVGGVPGLAMQVTATGARSWVLRVMVGVRRRDMGLGPFPAVPLALAREKARQARESVATGNDPILEREQARSALLAQQARVITFRTAAEKFVAIKRSEWKNEKHHKQWAATLVQYAYPVIGDMHVADVEQAHILRILEPIWTTKTETASRVRGRIETVLDWAAARGHRSGINPAQWKGRLDKLLAAPRKLQAVAHHPAVPIDDAAAFYAELSQADGIAARALQFAMLTATRSGEVRGAAWSEVDLAKGLWVIPAARMKAKAEHRVPISPASLALLNALPRIEGCDFVFPSSRKAALSDMSLLAVMRRMGSQYVPHGLRSTFRDWAAERTEFPRDLAEKALAHVLDSKTEAAYRRGDMVERRATMMFAWAQFLKAEAVTQNVL